ELEGSALRNGPPAGVLQGRSYDPGEALLTIEIARLLDGKSFPFEPVQLHGRLDDRRAVQVGAVLCRQSRQGCLARRREGRGSVADEDGGPDPQRVVGEVAVLGVEDVVLSAVGQGRTQR